MLINVFLLVSSYILINNLISHSPLHAVFLSFLLCYVSVLFSFIVSNSLSVFTGGKEEETWFATRRSFNYKTFCTCCRREKGISLFVYVICILNAILTLLKHVLMNFSGIMVSNCRCHCQLGLLLKQSK